MQNFSEAVQSTLTQALKKAQSNREWIPTYTRCLEQLLGYQFVVGCFTKLGIGIHCGFNREIDAVGGVVRNLDMSGLEK